MRGMLLFIGVSGVLIVYMGKHLADLLLNYVDFSL